MFDFESIFGLDITGDGESDFLDDTLLMDILDDDDNEENIDSDDI